MLRIYKNDFVVFKTKKYTYDCYIGHSSDGDYYLSIYRKYNTRDGHTISNSSNSQIFYDFNIDRYDFFQAHLKYYMSVGYYSWPWCKSKEDLIKILYLLDRQINNYKNNKFIDINFLV